MVCFIAHLNELTYKWRVRSDFRFVSLLWVWIYCVGQVQIMKVSFILSYIIFVGIVILFP